MTQKLWITFVFNKRFDFSEEDIKNNNLDLCFTISCDLHNYSSNKINELCESSGECLFRTLKLDLGVDYFILSLERGKKQTYPSFHIQGYIEFNKKRNVDIFNKKYGFSYYEYRRGTKEEAKKYVKKKDTKISNKIWEFKRNSFVPKINTKPVHTIWVYGPSGIGKSYWTKNFLLKRTDISSDSDICRKKTPNKNVPKLWFDLKDKESSILWIEEVRINFPDANDIIQFIDRGVLETKKGVINNNFKFVIVNSYLSPYEVFKHLEINQQIEILRRLYYYKNKSKVIELSFKKNNNKKFNEEIDRSKCLPKMLHEHLHETIKMKCICCAKCLQNIEH